MATIKAINSKASIDAAINYITRKEKTDIKLISGLNCYAEFAADEMKLTKAFWKKESGRQYKHYVQSFPPNEKVSHEKAHEIAVELCKEKFPDYEVIIATHKDREHIHSHIIVNSVSFVDGHKIQESRKDLQALKDYSDKLCEMNGLSICIKNDEITAYKKEKYKALEKALTSDYKSYVLECYNAVISAVKIAVSKEHFIEIMKRSGFQTIWNNRKYITFVNSKGKKVRNSNLTKTFKQDFGKEVLENGFEINARKIAERKGRAEKFDGGIIDGESAAILEAVGAAIEKSNIAIAADECERNNREADGAGKACEQNGKREEQCQKRNKSYASFDR